MRVRYVGRYVALELDGRLIARGEEAEISEEQFARVQHRGVEVVDTAELRGLSEGAAQGGSPDGVTPPTSEYEQSGGESAGEVS